MNTSDRRTFLEMTALTLAAGRLNMLRSRQQPSTPTERAVVSDELSALGMATAWINSSALSRGDLEGKVVLSNWK